MAGNKLAKAWLLCGALDALYATTLTIVFGKQTVVAMWQGVAAGPFGDAAKAWGARGALLGLFVHFAIMAVMAAFALALFSRSLLGRLAPWLGGTIYGLALWLVMYGIVLPARFGAPFPNPDPLKLILGLAPHVLLVGIPMAILLRASRQEKAAVLRSS